MKINGAELLIKLLEHFEVHYIAGIPGGANLPIYDALRNSSIEHVLVRHEQAAGFIAQGISRISGRAGVCLATSGPGATNLLTALADAWADSIPLIAITGQVSSGLIGTMAFQEVDICAMARPIIKKAYQLTNALELLQIIPEAFGTAIQGRRGPVLIDIPRDVQLELTEFEGSEFIFQSGPSENLPDVILPTQNSTQEGISEIIARSERPILYIGGGIIHSGAISELRQFVEQYQIPAVSTLMGLGALEYDNEYFLGMLGMHGTVTANLSMEEADLIIAIGARFDDRATGDFVQFCRQAKIIHMDIDARSIHKNRIIEYPWQIDAKTGLRILLEKTPIMDRSAWLSEIEKIKCLNELSPEEYTSTGSVPTIIRTISQYTDQDDIIVTDVGQHQMWVAQNYPFKTGGKFLTSGGLGTMGFGLPTAMGAALATPDKKVICFTGDGSIMMNIQELATLSELNLNVKIVLFNNGHLGLVRQQQHLFFKENYFASHFELATDFIRIAEGFGIRALKTSQNATLQEFHTVADEFLNYSGPCLLEVEIDHHEKVFPMVPPGEANTVMLLS